MDYFSDIVGVWPLKEAGQSSEPQTRSGATAGESFRAVPLKIRLHDAKLTAGMAHAIELASQIGKRSKSPPSLGADRRVGPRSAPPKTPEP